MSISYYEVMCLIPACSVIYLLLVFEAKRMSGLDFDHIIYQNAKKSLDFDHIIYQNAKKSLARFMGVG